MNDPMTDDPGAPLRSSCTIDGVADVDIPWHQILDELPLAISVLDLDGHQVGCNREYAELLGYSLDEVGELDGCGSRARATGSGRGRTTTG